MIKVQEKSIIRKKKIFVKKNILFVFFNYQRVLRWHQCNSTNSFHIESGWIVHFILEIMYEIGTEKEKKHFCHFFTQTHSFTFIIDVFLKNLVKK